MSRRVWWTTVVGVGLGLGLTLAAGRWNAWQPTTSTAPQDLPPTAASNIGPGATDRSPESTAAIRDLAAEAEQVVADLQQQFPDDPRTRHVAARLRHCLGQTDAARRLWEQCLDVDPQDSAALVSLGTLAFESGNHGEAELVLRAALTLSPADAQASFLLGNVLVQQGKFTEAIDVLHSSLANHPELLPNQVLLGQAYLQSKSYEQAKAAFLAATQIAPDYPNAYHGLATACARLGQTAEAAQYRASLKSLQARELNARIGQSRRNQDLETMQQTVAEVFCAAAELHQGHGDTRRAEQHWQRAIALDANCGAARAALADFYQRQERLRDALDILLPLQTRRPTDASLWWQIGVLHTRLREFPQAEQTLRQVTALQPQRAVGYAALAQLYLAWEGQAAQARTAADDAVKREPTAAHFALLAMACERCGDTQRAMAAIERALQLEPGNGLYQQQYLTLRRKH